MAWLLLWAAMPSAQASSCNAQDDALAKQWDSYYGSPQEAYAFGKSVQRWIENRDLKSLFAAVDGELRHGPSQARARSGAFDRLFSEAWRRRVLADEPPCAPMGGRGFMLSDGLIWYDKSGGQWHIVSIHGAVEEKADTTVPVGWRVDGQLLAPQCFAYEWLSSDNFQAFAQRFQIERYEDFSANPGKYIGRAIDSGKPVTQPSACAGRACAGADPVTHPDTLIHAVNDCADRADAPQRKGRAIWNREHDAAYAYELLGALPVAICQQLASSLDAACLESFLLQVGSDAGGSMGWSWRYGVYGVFDFPALGKSVVPLKFFSDKNSAMRAMATLP